MMNNSGVIHARSIVASIFFVFLSSSPKNKNKIEAKKVVDVHIENSPFF